MGRAGSFEPFRAKRRVLGRSEPELPGSTNQRKRPGQEPRGRMEKSGEKGRKWLSIGHWGRQLGECWWADTRDILRMVAGERRRRQP